MRTMNIGHLAELAGVNVDTVRYYERQGLLPPAARTGSGYRQYDEPDLERLRFIRRSKELGFTLAQGFFFGRPFPLFAGNAQG